MLFECYYLQLVLIWIEMYKEYETSGGKHNTAFLLVATSQIVYIVMEFFFDEVNQFL